MAGGRRNGDPQGYNPGPPWRFFLFFIMPALSRVSQRLLDSLLTLSFFATTSVLLLAASWRPHIGGGGHRIFDKSSCAASNLDHCDSTGLDFATPEVPPFVCGCAPHTPEVGRPTPPHGSRVLNATTLLSPLRPKPVTYETSTNPFQKTCKPASWTSSRSRSMRRLVRFRSCLLDLNP